MEESKRKARDKRKLDIDLFEMIEKCTRYDMIENFLGNKEYATVKDIQILFGMEVDDNDL